MALGPTSRGAVVSPAGRDNRCLQSRALLVGPTHQRGASATNIVGGNSIMMVEQQRELAARGFDVSTVDTSGTVTNLPSAVLALIGLLRFCRVFSQVARRLPHVDVVCSIQRPERMWDYGVALWLLCKAFRRPLALRVSGGTFGEFYSRSGRLRRLLADRSFMRADIVYVETRAAIEVLPRRDNLRCFPNTRLAAAQPSRDRERAKRLLFLSKIKPEKGLQACLDASQDMPEGCELSIYGAPAKGFDLDVIRRYPRAAYMGVADQTEIPRILAEHDLLLFPTHFANEGLPGVIIEAFQAGMPVITTRVGGIPELVEDGINGLLVEARSAADLHAAIRRIVEDEGLYRRLCNGARLRGDEFRSDRWYESFASDLSRIAQSP